MSQLQYHPYLGILAFVDQSDEFRISRLSLTERHRADAAAFESACQEYRSVLLKREHELNENASDNEDLDDLYQSYSCFAFGHTDTVMLTLSDLFDPLFILSQESEVSFEQLSCAFCPRIDSLELPSEHRRWLEEPHEFIQLSRNRHRPLSDNSLPFDATPLILISRMKIAGVAKLAVGGDITMGLLKATADTINQTILRICETAETSETSSCFPSAAKWNSNPDAIPFRCTVYESQGVAELTLVMRCNNLAVATLILHHLRALTISDILVKDPQLNMLQGDFPQFARGQILQAKRYDVGDNPTIFQNHVFATTYSTVTVDLMALESSSHPIEGNVAVDVNWVVSPGHLEQAHILIEEVANVEPNSSTSPRDHYHVRFGKFDLEYRVGAPTLPVISVERFLALANKLCEVHGQPNRETGVLDMSCILSIPIPISLAPQPDSTNHFPLAHIHSIISQGSGRELIGHAKTIEESHRWYRRKTLEANLKDLGIPRRLRDSIIYLFTNFLVCLNDPKLFDSILDLYDTFRATYHLFEDAAKSSYKVNQKDLIDIELHATALEDSCYYRLCLASPQHEMNDLAVHFRGGLISLLNGADTFLKVGAGIVRWICRNSSSRYALDKYAKPHRFGAITELCFSMQPRCILSSFGHRHGHALAHLKLNLGHVFHVNEAVYYLHEMGHVLQDLISPGNEEYGKLLSRFLEQSPTPLSYDDSEALKKCLSTWRREIFAEAFVYSFVCGFDKTLFVTQYLAGFSSQPERHATNDLSEKVNTLEEKLLVAFFAIYLFDERWDALSSKDDWEQFVSNRVAEFTKLTRPLMGAHTYRDEIFTDDASAKIFWNSLCATIADVAYAFATTLSTTLREIGSQFDAYHQQLLIATETQAASREDYINALQEFDAYVDSVVRHGKPLSDPKFAKFCQPPNNGCDYLLPLCCSMVRSYLRFCLREAMTEQQPPRNIQFHARRNTRGKTEAPTAGRRPARFMIDQGFAGYVAVRKQDRREAMLYAVAIHKTLQTLSNELRMRRLRKMLEPLEPVT